MCDKFVFVLRNNKMALKYITNNKEKIFLLVDNFTFYRQKIYKGKYSWRCTEYLKANPKMSHEGWCNNKATDGSQSCGGNCETGGKEGDQQH